jgi:cytochrome c553
MRRQARFAVPLLPLWLCAAAASPAIADPAALGEYRAAIAAKPDVENGSRLFSTCAACHGADGGGLEDGTVPALAQQHPRVIMKQLVDFRHSKRWDIRMEHFADKHHLAGPRDIADVAAYVASLPATTRRGIGDGTSLSAGTRVYFRDCERCHGATGGGNAALAWPRLAGQHYEYLVRQLHDTGDGRRPNMSADHVRLLKRMSVEEISGVADYLSRLSVPQRPQVQ